MNVNQPSLLSPPPAEQPSPIHNGKSTLGYTLDRLLIRVGHFMFIARNFLFPLVFVALVLTTQPQFPFGSEQTDWWMDLGGIGVACVGQI